MGIELRSVIENWKPGYDVFVMWVPSPKSLVRRHGKVVGIMHQDWVPVEWDDSMEPKMVRITNLVFSNKVPLTLGGWVKNKKFGVGQLTFEYKHPLGKIFWIVAWTVGDPTLTYNKDLTGHRITANELANWEGRMGPVPRDPSEDSVDMDSVDLDDNPNARHHK